MEPELAALSPLEVPDPAKATGAGLPLLMAAVGCASFIGMDTLVKLMSPRFGAVQLSFLRFASGSLFAVVIWGLRRSPLPDREAWRLHLLRSGLLLVSLVTYFMALSRLPLAQTVAVSYLAPIFVSVLAVPVLRERPSPAVWWALALGLGGVGVSALPALVDSLDAAADAQTFVGLAAAAFSALAFALVMLLLRHQARRSALRTILVVQNVLPALLLAPLAWIDWQTMTAADMGMTLGIGALATVGLWAMAYAYTRLEASRAAPVEYTSLVWASLFGYLAFGETPTAITAASAAIIIAGCLLLVRWR